MCYDSIDKSGLCDGLHPALVTYQFEPLANGTLACTDCSGEDLNKQRSDAEAACHCKVIAQNARNDQKSPSSMRSSQTCSCDVELATCIAASGHCAPPLLGITQH